jgi:chaperonin cofactor prefoldin
MPNQTTSKRISISLKPEVHNLISELAELQNKPMSRIVVELIEEMHPMLAEITKALKEIKTSTDPNEVVKRFGQTAVIDTAEALGRMSKEVKEL